MFYAELVSRTKNTEFLTHMQTVAVMFLSKVIWSL
jgi:hypothetical protein